MPEERRIDVIPVVASLKDPSVTKTTKFLPMRFKASAGTTRTNDFEPNSFVN
jgi:hypothetical protein